jgi:hypothetical protein
MHVSHHNIKLSCFYVQCFLVVFFNASSFNTSPQDRQLRPRSSNIMTLHGVLGLPERGHHIDATGLSGELLDGRVLYMLAA